MPLHTMPCVLFAGGKSSRMGEDKVFLPFGECPSLLQFQINKLEKLFSNLYVSGKNKDKFSDIKAIIIEDILYNEISSPLTGFINIFRHLITQDSFFCLSVDAPFVDSKTISKLVKASDEDYDAIIVKTASGIHPLCGVYTRNMLENMIEMIENEDYKLKNLLEKSNVKYIDVDNEDLLLNLNTPKDYQKALSLFAHL